MLKGLIRVLLEEEEECCKDTDALFSDAVAKQVGEFEDIIIYKTSSDLRLGENGESAETMWANTGGALPKKCEILNTLLPIKDNGNLSSPALRRIEEIQLETCPPAAEGEETRATQTCTDSSKDPQKISWYKFAYGGAGDYSTQARMDYYYMILDKLGIGMFAPGKESQCIEKIRVWEHKPEEFQKHPEVTQYMAPKLDWWKGFKIKCVCIPDNSPYKKINLNIFDLDHPWIKGTGVPIDKSSSGNITPTYNPVKVDNTSKEEGLIKVMNGPEITNPYEDITFL